MRNRVLVDSVVNQLFRTPEWRSVHRFIVAETAEDTPDMDGLILQVIGGIRSRMLSDAKLAQEARQKDGR
jgi:hypothetical protein